MAPARRPRPEPLHTRVPRLDAPPPPVVVREPPHVPHHEPPGYVRGERDVPLQRVRFLLASCPREYDDVVSALPPLRRRDRAPRDPPPLPLGVLPDRLLGPARELARHQVPLPALLEPRHAGRREELPVEEQQGDLHLAEPRLLEQARDDIGVVVQGPHVRAGDLRPPPLLDALDRRVRL